MLAVTGVGLFTLVYLVVRAKTGRPVLPADSAALGAVDGPAFLGLAIALFVGYQLGAFLILRGGPGAATAIVGIVWSLVLAGLMYRIALRRVLRPRGRPAHRALLGLLVLLAAMPVVQGLFLVMQLFGTPQLQEQVVWMTERRDGWQWMVIVAVVVAPIVEEVGFRGLLFLGMRRIAGPRMAIVASSALFGLVHVQVNVVAPLAVFGVFLAYLVEVTGSLLPSIVAHMAFNGLTTALALFG